MVGLKGEPLYMDNHNEPLFTTGRLAERTEVTIRTIRYYDQIGLLPPFAVDHAKGRLYRREDEYRLRKIQTLKYIGLSLNEIRRLLGQDPFEEPSLARALLMQKDEIARKAAGLNYVLRALYEATSLLDERCSEEDWLALSGLIRLIEKEKNWSEQYQTPRRLQTRIGLYDRFSTSPQSWHLWFFEQLRNAPNLRVLEVGCGDGALWSRNLERIPDSWKITLTDSSAGMLEEARNMLNDRRIKLTVADAQSLPFHDEEFDVVIANHMLYHVPDIPLALSEIRRVMKDDATLYASAMGTGHLAEIEDLAQAFDPDLRVLDPVGRRFSLDDGDRSLQPFFPSVRRVCFEDELLVDEVQPLLEYMTSTPMNARERLVGPKLEQFAAYLDERLTTERPYSITKNLGYFAAKKR